ncbi:MAG: hypothetical protein H0X24_19400 [Ktedonobacterales bacterium]|nr:hypothetical protein [Ktedonobacterales bacterium]
MTWPWERGQHTGGISYSDMQQLVREAVASANAPVLQQVSRLAEKVDTLTADHVTRTDIDGIRRDMQKGFEQTDSKYMSREMADRRYSELDTRITDLRGDTEKFQESIKTDASSAWSRYAVIGGIIFGACGFLISLYTNVIAHLSFHP